MYEQADIVTVPSQSAKEKVIAMGISEEKIRILPRGVDTELFHRRVPGEVNPYETMTGNNGNRWYVEDRRGNKPKVIIYVGRVANEKGYQELLQIAKTREFKDMNYHLVVVGPPGSDQIERELTRAGDKNPNFHYLGPRGEEQQSELASLYRNADAFFSPSMTETHGHTVNEALVSGVPVIVPRNQVTAARVVEGITGNLYESGNMKELMAAINATLSISSRVSPDVFDTIVSKLVIGWSQSTESLIHIIHDAVESSESRKREDRRRELRAS